MIASIFIDQEKIGFVNFRVIDESMGGLGGELQPTTAYQVYQVRIQQLYKEKGIANV